jgi:hypothetical protein
MAKTSTLRPASESKSGNDGQAPSPLTVVKPGRTQFEQMSSELPLKAEIAQCSRHVSNVPTTDIGVSIAGKPLLFTFTSGFAFPFL